MAEIIFKIMYIQNHTGWGLFKIIHASKEILSPIVGNSKNRLLLAVMMMVVAERSSIVLFDRMADV
ncbi:MAG: hypothetical protein ABRQ39_29565 [Candidatus Eremiobacterota bacterium]